MVAHSTAQDKYRANFIQIYQIFNIAELRVCIIYVGCILSAKMKAWNSAEHTQNLEFALEAKSKPEQFDDFKRSLWIKANHIKYKNKVRDVSERKTNIWRFVDNLNEFIDREPGTMSLIIGFVDV